jgi:hypothetical protein
LALAGAVPEVHVSEILAAPHRLVAALIEADRELAKQAQRCGWSHQSSYKSELNQRKLRIMSALYDALEKRGHRLEHPKDSILPVWCVINGEPIKFRAIEYIRPTRVPLSPAELKSPLNIADGRTAKTVQKPTGQLVLLANSEFKHKNQRWSDGASPLEDQLGTIILKFEEIAKQAAVHRVELAERNRQFEVEIALQNERRARKEKIAEDWEQIRESARDWFEAQRIRRFIDAVAIRLHTSSDPESHGRSWLDWVRREVEELDPIGAGAETTLSELLKGHGFHRWRDTSEEDEDEY